MVEKKVKAEISKCQIQFKLHNAHEIFEEFDGPSVTLDGVTFTPQVMPCENKKRRLTTLGFYLKCNWEKASLLKSCTVDMTFKLIRQGENPDDAMWHLLMPHSKKTKCTYDSEIMDWGFSGFIDWSDLVEPCWMQNGTITLQVEFEITHIEKFTENLVESTKIAKITTGGDDTPHPKLIDVDLVEQLKRLEIYVKLNELESTTNDRSMFNKVKDSAHTDSAPTGDCKEFIDTEIENEAVVYPISAVNTLGTWLFFNFEGPYPSEQEITALAIRTKLTRIQVSNWIIKARNEFLQPLVHKINTEKSAYSLTATNTLKKWLYQNFMNPNPTENQVKQLAMETTLNILEVKNWYTKVRKEIVHPTIDKMNNKYEEDFGENGLNVKQKESNLESNLLKVGCEVLQDSDEDYVVVEDG